jgi:hypothetical protein
MMVSKYYVAVRPQTNENHAVHKEGCPFLPDDEKRIYLGEFSTGQEAVSESHRHFTNTKGCLFCSKERKVLENAPLLLVWTKKEAAPVKSEIPGSYYQSLIYCVN